MHFIRLFIVIVAALLTVNVLYSAWANHQAEKQMQAAEQAARERAAEDEIRRAELREQQNAQREANDAIQRAKQRQQRREQARQAEIREKSTQTCAYWSKAFRQERSTYNQTMRDEACR